MYLERFNEALRELLTIVPNPEAVDRLLTEEEELAFVQAFRKLIRIDNILSGFSNFTEDEVAIDAQTFEDYKSKYLDIRDKVRTEQRLQKVSILNDVDFEVELIHRDQVNVSYIIRLLAALHTAKPEEREARRQEIDNRLANEVQLRSKRELIEKFIDRELPRTRKDADIEQEFDNFMGAEKQRAIVQLGTGGTPYRDGATSGYQFQSLHRPRALSGGAARDHGGAAEYFAAGYDFGADSAGNSRFVGTVLRRRLTG